MNKMGESYTKLGAVIIAIVVVSSMISFNTSLAHVAAVKREVPIATSGDKNVYVTWFTNKTGDDEVMFKASTDGGKTFGDKMNLSNSSKSDSQDAQIAAAGSNVYVSWWERNATSEVPVLRVSNDNGKSFGDIIKLSNP
jgi:hypothetical protein